jgi:hypothetical protein
VIIGTSLIMTWAMIKDKKKTKTLLDLADEEMKLEEMEEISKGSVETYLDTGTSEGEQFEDPGTNPK